ncbi:MAG: hypothetical protein NXI10_05520 [bacterium]|nr:hypothetical protein [bacterium]
MATTNFHFLTTTELFEKYPQVKNLGWNDSNVGLFLSSYLLLGLPRYRRRKGVVDERSFRALIKFTNELSKAHVIRSDVNGDYCAFDFLTPSEIVEEYAQVVHLLGWDESKIGRFLRCRLLIGIRNTKGKSNLVTRRSFTLLVDHAVQTINRRSLLIESFNDEIGRNP